MTLIPYAALKDDVPDEPKKTNDGQIVFTINIGSFILKVDDLTIRLAHYTFTENVINVLTIESDDFNWILDLDREKHSDSITVIAMTYDDRRRLKDLREGEFIPFSGVDDVIHEVTKVERNKGWRTTVTIQTYKDGAPVGQAYTVSGDDNSWFVAAIPPRAEL